jgi:hypothetical protein
MQREPDQFERLKADPFWKAPWRRPKDASTSKWVLHFIMQARTPKERNLADNYVAILDGLMRDKVCPSTDARISKMEGVEAAYDAVYGQGLFADQPLSLGEGDEDKIPWEEDAFSFVQRVAREYARMDEGDDKSVTRFLQDAYWAALGVRNEPDQFERLKADPFWEDWWRKPNNASTSKWVLYFIMRAKTTEVRIRATKYAVFLDDYLQWKSSSSIDILQTIKYNGGFEGAYEALQARKRAYANWSMTNHQRLLRRRPRDPAVTMSASRSNFRLNTKPDPRTCGAQVPRLMLRTGKSASSRSSC